MIKKYTVLIFLGVCGLSYTADRADVESAPDFIPRGEPADSAPRPVSINAENTIRQKQTSDSDENGLEEFMNEIDDYLPVDMQGDGVIANLEEVTVPEEELSRLWRLILYMEPILLKLAEIPYVVPAYVKLRDWYEAACDYFSQKQKAKQEL